MKVIIVPGVLIALLLSACGLYTPFTEPSTGDPVSGESIFIAGNNSGAPPCITCHTVGTSAMSMQLGPNLEHIATEAATRIEGQVAYDYIRESILTPEQHIVSGYRISMYANYATDLSDEDLTDLLAFLMTLE